MIAQVVQSIAQIVWVLKEKHYNGGHQNLPAATIMPMVRGTGYAIWRPLADTNHARTRRQQTIINRCVTRIAGLEKDTSERFLVHIDGWKKLATGEDHSMVLIFPAFLHQWQDRQEDDLHTLWLFSLCRHFSPGQRSRLPLHHIM